MPLTPRPDWTMPKPPASGLLPVVTPVQHRGEPLIIVESTKDVPSV
jgi:hypothetical protein